MSNWVDMPWPHVNGEAYKAFQWAKQHCPSYITNDFVEEQGVYYYRFYFGRERDRMWFALRWA